MKLYGNPESERPQHALKMTVSSILPKPVASLTANQLLEIIGKSTDVLDDLGPMKMNFGAI